MQTRALGFVGGVDPDCETLLPPSSCPYRLGTGSVFVRLGIPRFAFEIRCLHNSPTIRRLRSLSFRFRAPSCFRRPTVLPLSVRRDRLDERRPPFFKYFLSRDSSEYINGIVKSTTIGSTMARISSRFSSLSP